MYVRTYVRYPFSPALTLPIIAAHGIGRSTVVSQPKSELYKDVDGIIFYKIFSMEIELKNATRISVLKKYSLKTCMHVCAL